jgi:hypothetical protein
MFARNPYCFWCGIQTVLVADPPTRHNLATLDHLYSRYHPKRANDKRYVLACRKCNLARADAENRGTYFTPKLALRIEIARQCCAVTATNSYPNSPRRRVITTIEEAVAFAHEKGESDD